MSTLHDHIWSGAPLPPHTPLHDERPCDHIRTAIYAAARAALPAARAPRRTHLWQALRPFVLWSAAALPLFLLCTFFTLRSFPPAPDYLAQEFAAACADSSLAEEYGLASDDLERLSVASSLAWIELDLDEDAVQITYNGRSPL